MKNESKNRDNERMVARTTYTMDRGKLRKFVKMIWVPVKETEAEAEGQGPVETAAPAPRREARPSRDSGGRDRGREPRSRDQRGGRPERSRDRDRDRDRDRRDSRPASAEARPQEPRRDSSMPHRSRWPGMPDVSVVIRTSNGEVFLPELLDQIAAQKTSFEYEVIAVDAQSKDRTLDILSKRGIATLTVPADRKFIDQVVLKASGKVVVFVDSRSMPTSKDWLQDLASPLLEDRKVAISTGRQIPGPDRSQYERGMLLSNPFLAGLKAQVFSSVEGNPGAAFLPICNAAIAKHVWKNMPLGPNSTSQWTARVLGAGFLKVYIPSAAVELKGGSQMDALLSEAYRRGQTSDNSLARFVVSFGKGVWREWRMLNESGVLEGGQRGEAYWQALVVNSAALVGAIETRKRVKGVMQKLLPS